MANTNIAHTGTGYTWSTNTSATSNNNRVATPGVNDNDINHNVDVQPKCDSVNSLEATGVVFRSTSGDHTPGQVLAGVRAKMTSSTQVNSQPHLNSETGQSGINVYQVADGFFAFTSSMAIDTDGSDPDPDPDHQDQTTFQDQNGDQLGAHHVPFYVLGDVCPDRQSPCQWFDYREHNIKGLQFGLIFYHGQCIGALFGDTVGSPDNPRKLGEASVKSAQLLGIPSSGTTGGVDNGVTYVVFSGSEWVIHGTNASLNDKAQTLVQSALNALGGQLGPSRE